MLAASVAATCAVVTCVVAVAISWVAVATLVVAVERVACAVVVACWAVAASVTCVVAFVTVVVTVSVGWVTVDRTVLICSTFAVNVVLLVSTEDERDVDGLDVVCAWLPAELCCDWSCGGCDCSEDPEVEEVVPVVVVGGLPLVPVVWVPAVFSSA